MFKSRFAAVVALSSRRLRTLLLVALILLLAAFTLIPQVSLYACAGGPGSCPCPGC